MDVRDDLKAAEHLIELSRVQTEVLTRRLAKSLCDQYPEARAILERRGVASELLGHTAAPDSPA